MVYITRTHLLSCASSPRQHGSKGEFLCSNKTSLKKESAQFGPRLNFLKSYVKSYLKIYPSSYTRLRELLGFLDKSSFTTIRQCFHFSYLEITCPHFPALTRSFSHIPVANYIMTSQKGNWFCFLNLPPPSESSRPFWSGIWTWDSTEVAITRLQWPSCH